MKFLIFISLVSTSYCLRMHPVELGSKQDYLRVQKLEESVLFCRYDLSDDEQIRGVVWYHDGFNAFTWAPNQAPAVGEGLSEEDVVKTRKDPHLQFSRVHPTQAGKYRCEVTTNKGETYKSFEYQLLVIDMPIIPDYMESSIESCTLEFTWQAPPVSPKPTPKCGVYSLEHGYILTAANWMATPYYNGSIGYRLDKEEFLIRSMPVDAKIKCELGITKVDNSYIQLIEQTFNFTQIHERGCHPLEAGEGIELDYENDRLTCHAEIAAKDSGQNLLAHLSCKDGYMAKYPDSVTKVEMFCKGRKWEVGAGLTWNHFDNLVCVERTEEREPPPTSDHKPVFDAPPVVPLRAEGSSSTHLMPGFWSPLLVLGGLVASAFICKALKFVNRGKDPRHLA